MKQTFTIAGFIKIGKKPHIEALQKEGLIFANTLKYFRTIEQDELRNDKREGSLNHLFLNKDSNFTIQLENSKKIPFSIISGHVNEYDERIDFTHIFCLYCFGNDDITGIPFVDSKNIKFGGIALLITQPKDFIKRILDASKSLFETDFRPVNYFDEYKTHESLSLFDKPSYFGYQKEFRFHFKKFSKDPVQFRIGSIEDISLQIKAEKLTELRITRDNLHT